MEDYDKKIEELEKEIKELKKKKTEFELMNDNERLAEILHSKLCRSNHTDGCGWYYESWENVGYARKQYLDKANGILAKTNFKTAKIIINEL